jgi:hypothetical protein
MIAENDVGATDKLIAFDGYQLGVTRSGTYEIDFSLWHYCSDKKHLSKKSENSQVLTDDSLIACIIALVDTG